MKLHTLLPHSSFCLITTLFFIAPLLVLAISETAVGQQEEIWESEMLEFEALDRENNYPPESILFTGSSSIRLWDTLEQDMTPYPVIKRGFGGSKMTDVLHYADRYIDVHTFRAVVIFVANDIQGDSGDRSPEEVRDLFRDFILTIRSYNKEAPVFIIAITSTNSRWQVWPQSKEANSLIAKLCDEHENALFIPTEDLFLDSSGRPKPELFLEDQLHLNDEGYQLWTKRIRSYIDPVLKN